MCGLKQITQAFKTAPFYFLIYAAKMFNVYRIYLCENKEHLLMDNKQISNSTPVGFF